MAVTLALARLVGGNLAQSPPFQVRQLEILEHDLDQLLERDVGFVIVDAGAITRLPFALALAFLAGLAYHLAGPRLAVTLPYSGRVLTVDKAVFLDPAERNLDYLVFVFADDRLFGNDVGDIFAD